MTKRFEILDHTADIGLRAFGSDLQSLYENAARGMFSLIVDPGTVRAAEAESVDIEASDPTDLLVAWLHEILYRFDASGQVYTEVSVEQVSDTSLSATLHGEPFDADRHEVVTGIKAVTWHGARVEQTAEGWIAEVLLDV